MRRLAILCAVLTAAMLTAPPGQAVQPDERLADPALEARARDISAELRCLVCQNESIDSSNAPLAQDLRRIVRERLLEGDDDDAVMAYVTARYGDYVLLRPPLQASTYILWFGPFAILLVGGLGVFFWLYRRRPAAAAALTPEEEKRLADLLREEDGGRGP